MLGSSATITARPPPTPVIALLTNASAATLRPTCFMLTVARLPAHDMPSASSYATFSFGDQRVCTSSPVRRSMNSKISVDGVPG